jgi:hypothetical protein
MNSGSTKNKSEKNWLSSKSLYPVAKVARLFVSLGLDPGIKD